MLFREGLDLAAKEPFPERSARKPKKAIVDRLHAAARAEERSPGKVLSFRIKHRPGEKLPRALRQESSLPSAFYVLLTRSNARAKAERRQTGIVDIVAFIGKEVAGELVSVTKVSSR